MLISATISLATMITLLPFSPQPAPLAQDVGSGEAPAILPKETVNPVHEWLDKIEAKSKETQSVSGKVKYTYNQTLQGDIQYRFGRMIYTAGPPAKFAVQFDRRVVGRKLKEEERWYIFDGVWLVEKLVDKKQFFKWQVVPPNQAGNANPLALGRGPFVVPLNLKKDQILERFYVSIAEADAEKDPKNSVHLALIPKKDQRINFTKLDIWYDRDSLTLLKAVTMDESQTESTFELMEPAFNKPVDEKLLDVTEPKEEGWEVQITPWEEKK